MSTLKSFTMKLMLCNSYQQKNCYRHWRQARTCFFPHAAGPIPSSGTRWTCQRDGHGRRLGGAGYTQCQQCRCPACRAWLRLFVPRYAHVPSRLYDGRSTSWIRWCGTAASSRPRKQLAMKRTITTTLSPCSPSSRSSLVLIPIFSLRLFLSCLSTFPLSFVLQRSHVNLFLHTPPKNNRRWRFRIHCLAEGIRFMSGRFLRRVKSTASSMWLHNAPPSCLCSFSSSHKQTSQQTALVGEVSGPKFAGSNTYRTIQCLSLLHLFCYYLLFYVFPIFLYSQPAHLSMGIGWPQVM